jgi:hypothetical protein
MRKLAALDGHNVARTLDRRKELVRGHELNIRTVHFVTDLDTGLRYRRRKAADFDDILAIVRRTVGVYPLAVLASVFVQSLRGGHAGDDQCRDTDYRERYR